MFICRSHLCFLPVYFDQSQKVVEKLCPLIVCFKVVWLFNLLLFEGVSLCVEYAVDAESLTEQWMAFSLNHLNGAAPTMENLDMFARKEFSKRAANYLNTPAKEAARSSTGSSLTVYGTPISAQYPFIRMFHVFYCFLIAFRVSQIMKGCS